MAELRTLLNNRKSAGDIILEALDEILATYNFQGNEEKIDSGTENKSAETMQDIQDIQGFSFQFYCQIFTF